MMALSSSPSTAKKRKEKSPIGNPSQCNKTRKGEKRCTGWEGRNEVLHSQMI
jgi:hypothetical protein